MGTTGIVEPMSRRALLDTIRVELAQRRAEGAAYVAVSPGSYGQEFLRQTYGFDPERSVRCGNFIGETIDMGRELGFRGMLLIGHIGKLVKLSGGIMNTHSREADCRVELLAAAALFAGGSRELLERMLSCAATEEALALLAREEPEGALLSRAMGRVLERAVFYLNARAGEGLRVECLIYANACGELAKSAGASALLARIQTDPTAE